MSQLQDAELRRRFGALRERELRRAPSFHQVLERSAARPAVRARRPWRAIAVLALAAAAAIVFTVNVAQRTALARRFTTETLSAWTSPTARFLLTPGSDLVASPTLVPSVLYGITSMRAQPWGN